MSLMRIYRFRQLSCCGIRDSYVTRGVDAFLNPVCDFTRDPANGTRTKVDLFWKFLLAD